MKQLLLGNWRGMKQNDDNVVRKLVLNIVLICAIVSTYIDEMFS